MADRILKPDSGNDLVLQNDDGSAKIEINEAGTVVATPSVQVDNIKIDGNTISSTDTDGDIDISPNGNGSIDLNSGTLDLSAQTVDVTLNGAVDALNFDSNTLSIDASNNRVGIGDASPDHKIAIESSDSSLVKIQDTQAYSAGTSGPHIQFEGNDTAGTLREFAKIKGSSRGAATGELQFYTRKSTGLIEALRIDKDQSITTPNGEFNGTIGSSATFPAGHIIQTTLTTKNDEDSATNTSTTLTKVVDGSGNAEWVGQITNVASGNDVLVIMHFNFEVYDNPSKDSAGGAFGIFRNSDATAIYNPPEGATFFQNASSNQGYRLQQTLIHLDESPATGTNDYYLGYRSVVSGKEVLIHSASGDLPFSCILQEIQR